MPSRDPQFTDKDLPLRDDVRTLGALVGDVIREQGGEALFARVEEARTLAIAHRRGEPVAQLAERLGGLDPGSAAELVRAFSTYFQVINLVEQVHRLRRRRDYLRSGEVQPGSLAAALGALAAGGVEEEAARELFAGLEIEPVFTAHPTEATRRTLLEKQQRIAGSLVDRFDPERTPEEEAAALARIRNEVTTAWQTEEHPDERPTVADEREHVLFYVGEVLFQVVPAFHETLAAAFEGAFGPGSAPAGAPPIVRFASWVGGDMDGNPNVTAATLRETLARHRQLVLSGYVTELARLSRRLSQSTSRIGVSPKLLDRIERYGDSFPEVVARIRPRLRPMPYRVFLRLVAARLKATRDDRPEGYASAAGLREDLEAVAESLEAHRGEHAGLFAVRRLITRVATFGFHLATVDVRQDGLVHRQTVGRLLGDELWESRDAVERCERLRRAIVERRPPAVEPNEADRAVLDVFAAIADCRRRYGGEAIGPYIISMARDVDDLLSVLLLAGWGGLDEERPDGLSVPLDVAPLFETVDDLRSAPEVVERLAADPVYRPHLERRRGRQLIMIGYSDSNKDGGLAASRWALHQGQRKLVEVMRRERIDLTLFHGRGGTVSRGGGKTHRAIAASPRHSVAGRLRMTEQGEVIDAKYGLRGIALRTLERTAGAVALATALPRPSDPREERWQRIMTEIADDSRRTYRRLVYETPALVDYFRAATPIDVIERMKIGSRPASRRGGGGIENLRAIPWVFSWTQSRHLLPGWYGLGTALEAAVERHGRETVGEMMSDWLFLRTLAEDVEMVLAKADLAIAEGYAALAGEVGERLFPEIVAEYERTVRRVLDLLGSDELLDRDPTLQRSIRLRNPYVDPMSTLQIDLLRRWRAGGRSDDDLFQALLATVQGIARGLRNTG